MGTETPETGNWRSNLQATVQFLNGTLNKGSELARHVDTQSNILIGVSSAIFVFAASRFGGNGGWAFRILELSAALTALVALLAVHPPRFMRKRGQVESLLYHKKIAELDSSEAYCQELERVVGNERMIVAQYATEIYNLYKYSYLPKRLLYRTARNILLVGILLSLLVLFASLITTFAF